MVTHSGKFEGEVPDEAYLKKDPNSKAGRGWCMGNTWTITTAVLVEEDCSTGVLPAVMESMPLETGCL